MGRHCSEYRWWHWMAAVAAVLAAMAIGLWIESFRARIWAEELRKAGVAAPSEVR